MEDLPLLARSRAVSLPMPLLAPVISTVMSWRTAVEDQGLNRFLRHVATGSACVCVSYTLGVMAMQYKCYQKPLQPQPQQPILDTH